MEYYPLVASSSVPFSPCSILPGPECLAHLLERGNIKCLRIGVKDALTFSCFAVNCRWFAFRLGEGCRYVLEGFSFLHGNTQVFARALQPSKS